MTKGLSKNYTCKVRMLLEEVVNNGFLVVLEGFCSINWSFWRVRIAEVAVIAAPDCK